MLRVCPGSKTNSYCPTTPIHDSVIVSNISKLQSASLAYRPNSSSGGGTWNFFSDRQRCRMFIRTEHGNVQHIEQSDINSWPFTFRSHKLLRRSRLTWRSLTTYWNILMSAFLWLFGYLQPTSRSTFLINSCAYSWVSKIRIAKVQTN